MRPDTSAHSPRIRYLPGSSPLVLDSPHSGVDYPADFDYACDLSVLRSAEDTHVEKLYDCAAELGIHWLEALFPRSYLDANRNTTELDIRLLDAPWPGPLETAPEALAKVRLGKGLIWRSTDQGIPIYTRLLTVAEVQARIAHCWQPYHAALAQAIDRAHSQHGYCIHINCHSMPAVADSHATEFPGAAHPDFVLGDRDGSTADPALSRWVCDYLRAQGFSVSYNHPYKGVELIRRHSDPLRQRHSLQLEINRSLYMDEATREMLPHASQLKAVLRGLLQALLQLDPRALPDSPVMG